MIASILMFESPSRYLEANLRESWLITQVSIKEKSSLNMSSHVPVLAQLNILKSTINMCVSKSKTKSFRKLNWEKVDIQHYQRELAKVLQNKTESQEAITFTD